MHRAHSQTRAIQALVLGFLFAAATSGQDAPRPSPDETAIRDLMGKVNQAWSADGDPRLFREVLSDRGYVLVMPRRAGRVEATVLNKTHFCEIFEFNIQKQRPKRHEHEVSSVNVLGPVAYAFGVTTHVPVNGPVQRDNVLNVFAREPGGWRMVFSTTRPLPWASQAPAMDDEKVVRELARELVAGFRLANPTSSERVEQILADDVQVATSDGRFYHGKPAVAQFYRKVADGLAAHYSSLDARAVVHNVRILGDGALLFGRVHFVGRTKQNGKSIHQRFWESLTFRKESGRWRLIQEHSTPDSTKATAAVDK